MVCSKCKGKLKVIDKVDDDFNWSVYRRKRCLNCAALIYTEEIEVDYETIKYDWNTNHRKTLKNKRDLEAMKNGS